MSQKTLSDEQCQEALDYYAQYGTKAEAARQIGLQINTFKHRLSEAIARDLTPQIDDSQGFTQIDNGQVIGTSTQFDGNGRIRQQWVKEKPEETDRQAKVNAWLEGMKAEIPRAAAVKLPPDWNESLMVAYPVGDHHLGMYAWQEETGADYDIEIAENLLYRAMRYLVDKSPSASVALIPLLGDFLHYDSMESVTPQSRNQLDSDTRFPVVVRAAIRAIRFLISEALKKHGQVRLIIEIGNHDTASSIWLMEALDALYENEPRVTVDTSPKHFHFFRFGKVLIATHHGHKVKAKDLPLLLATDAPAEWGETDYRYWYTGHIHHETKAEYGGAVVESFRVLAPQDAWHHTSGYRALPDMKSIVLHKEYGEQGRNIVSPGMLSD